jgi:adenylate kinase
VNIQGVKEQFMGNIIEIDGNKSKRKIVEEMARMLALKDSSAPRQPPKIIMMGPPGVEPRMHAKEIQNKYKLIYIDVDQMVKDCVRREGESADALRQIIKNGEQVPDDVVMKLLRQRLYMPDCKTNGWII